MRAFVLLAGVLLALIAPLARAQVAPVAIITSTGPQHVSVTLYRAPDRGMQSEINRASPQGFALITETRTVTLPAGPAVIRFEGVAGNILPESALVAGLPAGVEEKNLDADLLSPRSLFDRALGRRVMVRRTDPATGKVVLQQATIRSSSAGAAVLDFGGSYGDLHCSGLPETLIYDGVPPGLSAKPTLSVSTTSPAARTVTLTLSYLAGGFDWQADYIVAMRPDGRSADLFAWITLASSDVTSFADADLQVVAGKPDRDDQRADDSFGPDAGDLPLKCWPMPSYNLSRYAPSLQFAPPAAPMMDADARDIVVTGSLMRRSESVSPVPIAVLASAEQLGDLKLYRFPRRVTVASNAQKQVAMLSKPSIKLAPVYQSEVSGESVDTALLMRGRNVTANGLGVALPAGKAAFFARAGERSMMVGESSIDDKTVGEDVEFNLGEPGSVDVAVKTVFEKDREQRYELTVTNANAWPIDYEAKIPLRDGWVTKAPSSKLGKKDGGALWSVRVPANGSATLSYTMRAPLKRDDD